MAVSFLLNPAVLGEYFYTHDGMLHADEVVAKIFLELYLGRHFWGTIRTRDKVTLAVAAANLNAWIVDVNMVFNPATRQLDHHQDLKLPSSAGLVWQYFLRDKVPVEVAIHIDSFVAAIDNWDTNSGFIQEWYNTQPQLNGFINVSQIVAGFNRNIGNPKEQDQAFYEAYLFCFEIVKNVFYAAEEKAKSEREYNMRTILGNNVAVFENFSNVWKSKGHHQFAIMPHPSGWQLQSASTQIAVIPEDIATINGFVFRHASGFIAASSDKIALIEYASKLRAY